nr:uncharacterized protein LOC113707624 [Coffea arabica]XP_027085689.1 uncharacterized protein LOC113707624 [Coffea arabica]
MQRRASWDALPSTSLVEIFCRTPIKDRFCSLPLVCRSWADVSRNPRCWASMIPAEHSSSACAFDDAFIKHSSSSSYSRLDRLAFDDPFDGRRSPDSDRRTCYAPVSDYQSGWRSCRYFSLFLPLSLLVSRLSVPMMTPSFVSLHKVAQT